MNLLPLESMVRGRKNPLYFGFSTRLKMARKTAGHSRFGLTSKTSSLDRDLVSSLEQGHRVPRLDTVEKIARALGLSPAFLAYGLSGECQRGEALQADEVGVRLRTVRLSQGLSVLAVAEAAGTSHTAVGKIERGGTMPTIATVEALAKALDVSPAWLAYGIGPQEPPSRRRARSAAISSSLASK